MQASKRQKVQNTVLSIRSATARAKQQAASKITLNRTLDEPCVPFDRLVRRVTNAGPAIIAHMKLEKMRPNGRSSVDPVAALALCRAADQKKMKRYIVPSNTHEIRPNDRI